MTTGGPVVDYAAAYDVTAVTVVKQLHRAQKHCATALAFYFGAQQPDDVHTGPRRLLVLQPW